MQFKSSAFIFVTGLVLFVIGGFLNAIGISMSITSALTRSIYSSSSNGGAIFVGLLGAALALTGLIQMCMGAYRALSKIDALPVPAAVEPGAVAAPVPAEEQGAAVPGQPLEAPASAKDDH